jgi:hypothetical protein
VRQKAIEAQEEIAEMVEPANKAEGHRQKQITWRQRNNGAKAQ